MARRTARSAIRRQVAEARRRADEPPAQPPGIAAYLERYVPRGLTDAEWALSRPVAMEILRRCPTQSLQTVRSLTPPVVQLVAWALANGTQPEWRAVLTHPVIDEWVRAGATHRGSTASKATTRSRLRTLASDINPGPDSPRAPDPIRYQTLQPPYSAQEQARLRSITLAQPSDRTGRQVALAVGCGLGAGLDSVDLRPLHGRHFTDLGDDGIRVDVPGSRARVVWVRREWEDLVRRGLVGVRADDLAIGVRVTRKNVAGSIYARVAVLGDPLEFNQSRMRTTWLATLMAEPVPLATVMRAAGLRTARTLCDLLPYLPGPDGDAERGDGGR